jgi:hypothetical protein
VDVAPASCIESLLLWMGKLAAVMLSLLLLTTALLTHALVATNRRPVVQPASLADRARDDHGRQPVFFQGP